MKDKYQKIANKYDIYNVEFTINEFVKNYFQNELGAKLNQTLESYKLYIRIVISVAILYSYFHVTPFPLDKPLIAVCTFIYFVFNFVLEWFEKLFLKKVFAIFDVEGK